MSSSGNVTFGVNTKRQVLLAVFRLSCGFQLIVWSLVGVNVPVPVPFWNSNPAGVVSVSVGL